MHYPVEFSIGPAHLPAHFAFEMLAFISGYRLYVWLRAHRPDRISDEHRMWIFVGAAGGAWLGSHLLGLLENPPQLLDFQWKKIFADKTIVGGLLGGLVGVEYTKKLLGVTASSGDLMTFPLLLGIGVGRIGCHLAGLEDGTHGAPTTLPWGVDFGDGLPRHPVNLYEIGVLGLLGLLIYALQKRTALPDGAQFKIFMIGYLCWRFAIEFWKPVWVFSFGLSVIQVAALAGLVYYQRAIGMGLKGLTRL